MRKLIDKKPTEKANEIRVWKNKFKEMEKEKDRVDQSLQFMTRELETETRGFENLRNQLEYMKMHFAHLAPKAVQLFESEYMNLMDEPDLKKGKTQKKHDKKVEKTISRNISYF